MSPLPLFIDQPSTASVAIGIPAIENTGNFTVHLIEFDEDILRLICAATPCAIIVSITDQLSSARAFQLLDRIRNIQAELGITRRDPTLRSILITEGYEIPIERWQEVGIHEYIPGPISEKALTFKLARHFQKATTAEPPSPHAPLDDQHVVSNRDMILVKGPSNPNSKNDFYIIPKDSNSAIEIQKSKARERLIIKGTGDLLGGSESKWIRGNPEDNETETWKLIRGDGKNHLLKDETVIFVGDKPKYDPGKKTWIFTGEKPRLYSTKQTSVQDSFFSTSADGKKVFVIKNSPLTVSEIRHRTEAGNPQESDVYGRPENIRIREIEGKIGIEQPSKGPMAAISNFLDRWRPRSDIRGEDQTQGAMINNRIGESQGSSDRNDVPDDNEHGTEIASEHLSGPGLRDHRGAPSQSETAANERDPSRPLSNLDGRAHNSIQESTSTLEELADKQFHSSSGPEAESKRDKKTQSSDTVEHNQSPFNNRISSGEPAPPPSPFGRKAGISPSALRKAAQAEAKQNENEDPGKLKNHKTTAAGRDQGENSNKGDSSELKEGFKKSAIMPTMPEDPLPDYNRNLASKDSDEAKKKKSSLADSNEGDQNKRFSEDKDDDRTKKFAQEKDPAPFTVRITQDSLAGSKTWSMQNEEDPENPNAKKKKRRSKTDSDSSSPYQSSPPSAEAYLNAEKQAQIEAIAAMSNDGLSSEQILDEIKRAQAASSKGVLSWIRRKLKQIFDSQE